MEFPFPVVNPVQKGKLRFWSVITAAAIILLGGLAVGFSHRHGLGHLAVFLGFDLPEAAKLQDYAEDRMLFDSSQSWLVQFPAGAPRPWESSARFSECPPHSNPLEDYSVIRGLAHSDFPDHISRFQHPRIWRGGHNGNCYVASSDDGELVFFHYFTT